MAADADAVLKRLGAHLKTLRIARQWSQEELGARAGLSYKFVGEVERGRANPSVTTLVGIAEAFDVGITELFGREPGTDSGEFQLSREELSAVREAKNSLDGIIRRLGEAPTRSRPRRKRKRRLPI